MIRSYKRFLLSILIPLFLSVGCDVDNRETITVERTIDGGSSRLAELLSDDGLGEFPLVANQRSFSFPADHGPHPEYRNEWWYFTGNLDSSDGSRFGYELTLFRFALSADEPAQDASSSAWIGRQVYIGHFAVTDVDAGQFHVGQRYSRGAAGLAGARSSPTNVWLDDWSIRAVNTTEDQWRLQADETGFGVDLNLAFEKEPVLNGVDGLSQKSSEPGNASYYYSVTRLQTNGTIRIGRESVSVKGLSWLDREWGSSALSRQQVGWDWFALQLSDGSDLMYYNLRKSDGTNDAYSSGTLTRENGEPIKLDNQQVDVTVLDYWESEKGGRYPSAWALKVPGQEIDIEIRPVLDNQELITTVRYWEGAVDVSGVSGGTEISGRGYVELTGYAD